MTDGQKLFDLQHEFKQGNTNALTPMYKILYVLAYKYINAICEKDSHVKRIDEDGRRIRAHDAATGLIEKYLKDPAFTITDSITGYLYKMAVYEVYGRFCRHCDKMLVFTDTLPEKENSRKKYIYTVENMKTGEISGYETAAELLQRAEFRTLRKCRLAESIRTGRPWKIYLFDLLEVNE